MQPNKVRHIFIFFLLFDAVLLIISNVSKQKAILFRFFNAKTKVIKQNSRREASYFVSEQANLEKHQKYMQLKMTALYIQTTATNYRVQKQGYQHQLALANKPMPKLMLFPYHSYW